MEFYIVPFQTAVLVRDRCTNPTKRGHGTKVSVDIRKTSGVGNDSEERFSTMLRNSLAKASVVGCKRQRLDPSTDSTMVIFVGYNLETGKSVLRIGNKMDDGNTWFSRMERVCGGVDKFSLDADIRLFSNDDDKHHVEVRGKYMGEEDPQYAGLHYVFNIPMEVIEKWEAVPRLTAILSVKVKLSDEAVERVYLDNMENPLVANKAMLMDSSTSDAIIVAANGEEVKCHRGFLSAHSDVFKAMFESDLKNDGPMTIQLPEMNEASVRALLAYLYCWEIKEISRSSSIALELLVAADKYNLPKLLDSTRDIFLLKENEWFTPSVTVRLLQFARNKGDLGEEEKYKLIKEKCVAVLKSIPKEELHECLDYQHLFADAQAGMEFCSYLLHA